MAGNKKVAQGHLEEKLAAKKRAKKPEVGQGKPIHQIVQRLAGDKPDTVDPESIKELQRTVGNRVVGRLLSPGESSGVTAVQREAWFPASDKDMGGAATGTPDTVKLPPSPGMAPPSPFPNKSDPSQAPGLADKVSFGPKMGSAADSAKTQSGFPPPGMMGPVSPTGPVSSTNKVQSPDITPSQSKIMLPTPSPGSVEPEAPSGESTQTPEPVEQEQITPEPTPSPPSEEPEVA